MVRNAFRALTEDAIPTRLISFSDDMDGLRKVPDNVPNREAAGRGPRQAADQRARPLRRARELRRAQQRPHARLPRRATASTTSSCRPPNATARAASTTTLLRGARALRRRSRRSCCRRWARSGGRPIRRSCRSARRTGRVLQVPIAGARSWSAGPSSFEDEDGTRTEVPVTGGAVKLQWKPDWACRWTALDVDYEMSGKDLINSVKQSSRICRVLGGEPPEGFNYETVPRRAQPEDLQVQGQRPDPGGMAALRRAREPGLLPVSVAALGQEALFRRHPQGDGRVSAAARRLQPPRGGGRHAGAIAARQPGVERPRRRAARGTARPCPSACCSTWSRRPTPRTRRSCGASSPGSSRARRPRASRCSTGWPATPSTTTRTSCGRRSGSARPTTANARRWRTCSPGSAPCPPAAGRRDDPERGLRRRQGRRLRAAARLVLRPLRGAAGPAPGTPLRLLRRHLRPAGDHRPDARRARGRTRLAPVHLGLAERVLQRSQPGLVMPPLVQSLAEDGPADLFGAGGAHGASRFVETQAGVLERQAAVVQQPADLRLRCPSTTSS